MKFLQLLTLLFIGLKLANEISWSWWLVLAPTWIPILFIFIVLVSLYYIDDNSFKKFK
jgi:hypothetical protein